MHGYFASEEPVMTVAELISKLNQCNQEAVVKVVSLYDGKYEPISVITSGPRFVMLDVSDEAVVLGVPAVAQVAAMPVGI